LSAPLVELMLSAHKPPGQGGSAGHSGGVSGRLGP
jgi:hypothetical protein